MTLGDRIEPHLCSQGNTAPLDSQQRQLPTQPTSPAVLRGLSPPGAPGPLLYSTRPQNNHSAPEQISAKSKQPPAGPAPAPAAARHGTTPFACLGPDLSGNIPLPSPATTDACSTTTSPAETEIEACWSSGALGRRQTDQENRRVCALQSPFKRQRLAPPGSLSFPTLSPRSEAGTISAHSDTTSPPLFSSSSKRMTPHPASGLPVHMMGTVRETPEGVTTLRLPKGQVSTASPSRTSSTPGSWTSTDISDTSRSPDDKPYPSAAHILQNIGAIEFLDQDERPTFIIDLVNSENNIPGPFRIVFSNSSLRGLPGILELLVDNPDTSETSEFNQFKSWVITSGKNNESSSDVYGGIRWSCTTLRKRFRVVSGLHIPSLAATPTALSQNNSPGLTEGATSADPEPKPDEVEEERAEDADYFGSVEMADALPPHLSEEPPELSADHVAPLDIQMLSTDDGVLGHQLPLQLHTTFDWTRIPEDDPNLGPHHRFARSVDWASTSLGPVEEWPADLRIMSNMIMGSPHPAAMYWGQDCVAIYNEAYISVAGKKHPQLMGSRYKDCWTEIWDEVKPVFDAAWENGVSTMKYDDELHIVRHGFLEETFFNWAIIPLVGGDGNVVAIYNPAFENTRRKINERRMLTLREVGVKTSQARDVKTFWGLVQQGLEYNEHDVPFALIYSVSDGGSDSEVSSMNSGTFSNPPQIVLEGSFGVPEGHISAPPNIDLKTSDEGFAHYMRDSMAQAEVPIVLSDKDGTLPTQLLDGLTWRGFGDPSRTIVVFPVHPTTAGDMVVGFIIMGVNPRRDYDEDYELFVTLLSRQLATSLASVVLFEEEKKRGERAAQAAALDKERLSIKLQQQTQQAVEHEYRFSRMAAFGPVGLFIADGGGHINYCNEMWWKISGHGRGPSTLDAWMQSIQDADRKGVEDAWHRLVQDKTPITHEFRFKARREITDGHSVDTWALMSAYPERDESGELKSIFGCITDISQQKWAEDFQKQRRDEAVELKRQQENFIDITSHEMRNPLSAILQCADEISSGLTRFRLEDPSSNVPGALNTLLDSCVEAANTISLCASHQKRIVDDILTLSKLDSKLLLVTPVDVQPVVVVQNVMRMFEAELASNDITGEFRIEQSYHDLKIDWVKLDPSRLRQVLINLMTNAVKFTQGRPTRSITITLGASREVSADVSYFPPHHTHDGDITDEPDWANGEKINLHLTVSDTGPGLGEEEKKILFQRFSQASPRTHVQYGGSGLGLFICRILTELQGGQIGVQSQRGEGSTFAFYIKSRRSDNPQPDQSASVPTPGSSPLKNPVSLPPARQTQYPTQAPPSSAQISLLRDPGLVQRLDVLIVEDNLVNQRVLQRQLQLSGSNTFVANHGGEALDKLRRSRFWNKNAAVTVNATVESTAADEDRDERWNISVILMDLEMPVMDGMTCTREIRRLEGAGVITHHIPIIAVTAYARPEQIASAKTAGVDDVISKPFRIPDLIPKIEELVAKYNTQPTDTATMLELETTAMPESEPPT
ncbi:putative histidine kinase [Rhypophila decipiens]|uniref:Histidine kinase n=1 Tax=Rhypophila decipiens TaxID=261697 RepID=A0AAN6YIT6_9PEZI|nr:putative histidine kinase [Rhypophila decipiens]